MEVQSSIMTRMHYRLSVVATWARLASWVVLIFFILSGVAKYLQDEAINVQIFYERLSFAQLLASHPVLGINMILDVATAVLKGVVYWLVLSGISLGLNMIVETDLNFRSQRQELP